MGGRPGVSRTPTGIPWARFGPKRRVREEADKGPARPNVLTSQVVSDFEATGRIQPSCRWTLENGPINALAAPIPFDKCTREGLSPTITAP
jgi:hypothetical protein